MVYLTIKFLSAAFAKDEIRGGGKMLFITLLACCTKNLPLPRGLFKKLICNKSKVYTKM